MYPWQSAWSKFVGDIHRSLGFLIVVCTLCTGFLMGLGLAELTLMGSLAGTMYGVRAMENDRKARTDVEAMKVQSGLQTGDVVDAAKIQERAAKKQDQAADKQLAAAKDEETVR